MQINAEWSERRKIKKTYGPAPHTEISNMRYLYGCLAIAILVTPVQAASLSEQRGFVFANTNCARCHAIDRFNPSPLKIAPAFRNLHRRYKVDTLAEAFAEGIYTGHPTMPVFQLDPDQIGDLISFMKSLE